jgi:hypothetical protein
MNKWKDISVLCSAGALTLCSHLRKPMISTENFSLHESMSAAEVNNFADSPNFAFTIVLDVAYGSKNGSMF